MLEFQAVIAPDVLMLHATSLIKCTRNNWTLCVRGGNDGNLPEVLEVDGKRYCLYNEENTALEGKLRTHLWVLASLLLKSRLTRHVLVRIKVEWVFKIIEDKFAPID